MKWRILIVDDEPDVRLIIKTTLMGKYEVLEAHDGLDALEKVERFEPDFVLMDVMMPLMNGFEACAAIRKMPKFHGLPVMFLTALGAKEDHMKGFAAGANRYMTKPFDPSRLLKNVDNLFDELQPVPRQRRYSIDQIRKMEDSETEPVAPGAGEYNVGTAETIRDLSTIPDLSGEAQIHESATGKKLLPRVMIVDDTLEIIELVRMSLQGLTEVVQATDGMDAIEKLVKYQPEILILDIMLPKMNGFQLCQSLRANRAFSRIPILVCSARSSDRDINMAKRLGANDFLPKPFSPSELMTKIADLQQLPGFRVRPKTFSIVQIDQMEGRMTDRSDVFDHEEDARGGSKPAKHSGQNIGRFLAKEGNKQALEKAEEPAAGATPAKRKFFGFGRE